MPCCTSLPSKMTEPVMMLLASIVILSPIVGNASFDGYDVRQALACERVAGIRSGHELTIRR
jgi:hypothetical protein